MANADARIVYRNVQTTQQRIQLPKCAIYCFCICYIAIDNPRKVRMFFDKRLTGNFSAIDDNNASTFLQKSFNSGSANSACTTSDQHSLVFQTFHHNLLRNQSAMPPPSTTNVAPVMNDESLDAR